MGQEELARAFFSAVEGGNWEEVSTLLSDDFTFHGPPADPCNREVWMDLQRAVIAAFPDWRYNIIEMQENEDHLQVTLHITGSHTNDLVLPFHSLSAIPATNIKLSLPQETAVVTFNEGKINCLKVHETPHGGVQGILDQLKG
jgi:hypothetical protein